MCEAKNSPEAISVAVQVLRRIYGENPPSEWKVSLNAIAAIIDEGLNEDRRRQRDLIEQYQETFRAVDLLSKPPLWPDRPQQEQLRSMLSDRLEAIQDLARQMTTRRTETSSDD
jgi:hypothetical protein